MSEKKDAESANIKSSRSVALDLPGAYAARPAWHVTREQLDALSEADREILWLASEVSDCAESARSLVLGESQPPADVDAAKSLESRRMGGMLRAWFGFRAESAAPYRDARMMLTARILGQASALRRMRVASGASPQNSPGEAAVLDAAAVQACWMVGALYPTLASYMRDSDRRKRARDAIESAATTDKRAPWKLIAAVWKGVEQGEPDPERWRKDWYEHSHRP